MGTSAHPRRFGYFNIWHAVLAAPGEAVSILLVRAINREQAETESTVPSESWGDDVVLEE